MENVNIFWFRRDLRVDDNNGFLNALMAGLPVIPVFIFDPGVLKAFPDKNDARLTFIYQNLWSLNEIFHRYKSNLQIYFSSPENVFGRLASKYNIKCVYTNTDYEPSAIERDAKVEKILNTKGIDFLSFKDQVIFHQNEIVKSNGKPYTVFTPYSKKWKEHFLKREIIFYESEKKLDNLKHLSSDYFPELLEIGYNLQKISFPEKEFDTKLIENYANTRDFPALNGTSKLGIHLRFGTISIRKLTKLSAEKSEIFLNELIWRNFYMDILWHFPHSASRSFKPAYDSINWRNNEAEFELWCNGQTGYPFVDAGMRELNETGYLHNRARMVVASFLIKHLLIDWRWGESYFASKLHDYEMASNNGGWQWASGSGCDATSYFRIFNPELQMKKFDPNQEYVTRWVPEYGTSKYTKPIIEHAFARNRAIETYRKSLK